jgi:phosphoglycerate kinase
MIIVNVQLAEDSESKVVSADSIPEGWLGLDIGPKTIQSFSQTLSQCKTVVWNGPMGVFEVPKVN